MGRISGNENSFPTIKQVNDTLSGGGTLDISEYLEDLFALTDTTSNKDENVFEDNEYVDLDNQHIIEMLEKIIEVKPTILKGAENVSSLSSNINFETSNIKWCITSMSDNSNNYVNQWIISFNIYLIAYGSSYHFSFFKMLNNYYYSKYFVDANGF